MTETIPKVHPIYNMKLHDKLEIKDQHCETCQYPVTLYITRVPGGWLYSNTPNDLGVFVPFDNSHMR